MLHRLQRPFLLDESQFLLLHCSFFSGNHRFQSYLPVRLRLRLFVQLPVSQVKPLQCCFGQLDGQFPVFFPDLEVFFGFLRLVFQAFQLVIDLEQEILDPGQVLLSSIQLLPGFLFPGLVDGNPRRLLQHPSTAIVLILDDIVHHP